MREDTRILIVGAGIGGLALAIGLERRGFAPVLVERAPSFSTVGAGLALGINAMAVLRALGADDAVRARGLAFSEGLIADSTGRTLQRLDASATVARHGPSVAVHRASLHEALAERLNRSELRFATTVATLDQHIDGVDVEFSDGTGRGFDIVVGADGIRSATREYVEPAVPRYAGYTSWRFVLNGRFDAPCPVEMWGRGKRMGLIPIGKESLYVFATLNTPEDGADPDQPAAEWFPKLFAEFRGPAAAVLASLAQVPKLIRTDIGEVALERWSNGRILLLGDAAHAMTPNLGQGAAMALEDAWTLSEALASADGVDETFARFEHTRRPRVRTIQDQSRAFGRIGQIESALLCRARNLAFRLTPARLSAKRVEKLLLDGCPAPLTP